LQPTSARRRAMSATANCGEHIARLMRCPEAARLNWTVRDQPGNRFAKLPPYPRLKRPQSNLVKPTRELLHASGRRSSYGVPVLVWRRPGGSGLAITNQGSQAYLSLPPSCFGVSYSKAQQQGSPQSLGFREDERDSVGKRPLGRGKRYLTRTNERPFRRRMGATDVRTWGRRMAPRGF
jgi:hypothetical protein